MRAGGAHHGVLQHQVDRYDGVIIMDASEEALRNHLNDSINHFKALKRRGVWLHLSPQAIGFAGEAVAKHGFQIHSADSKKLILTKWLPADEGVPSSLPSSASHYVGVGCLVLNSQGDKMLVVQEKNGILRGKNFWKIPTGQLEAGEDLETACVRELKEETGINGKVKGLVLFRHATQFLNGKGDIFFIMLMELAQQEGQDKDKDQKIVIQENEIADAKWMPLKEYFDQNTEALWPAGRVAYQIMNENIRAAIADRGLVWDCSTYSEGDKSAVYHPKTVPLRTISHKHTQTQTQTQTQTTGAQQHQ